MKDELQLSLVELHSGLYDLWKERDEAETPEQVAMIDAEIQRHVDTHIRKVDGIADFAFVLDRLSHEPRERKGVKELCDIDQEIERLKVRRDRFRNMLASIKDMLKFAMQGMDWQEGKPRKLEGVRHTISLRGNGGALPVIPTDESLIPDEFWDVTVKMDGEVFNAIWGEDDLITVIKRELSLSRIAKALNEPCEYCEGAGKYVVETDSDEPITCKSCGGIGKASVAGARLGERGESVIIS